MNFGYRKFPPGVYFNGDFTVTFWIYLRSFSSGSGTGIFDFANGTPNDNIMIAMQVYSIGIRTTLCKSSQCSTDLNMIGQFESNKWYFISIVLENSALMIYVNGVLNVLGTIQLINIPFNVTRNSNYVGGTNFGFTGGNSLDGKIDDLKIFNRSLNQTEINIEMNSSFL